MSQTQEVLDFIQENGGITTMDAFGMGITRLASRVHELRRFGIPIATERVKGVNRHGKKFTCIRYKIEG